MEFTSDERDVLLAALFELWLTRSDFDDDPDMARTTPFVARIEHNAIRNLVAKLGGDFDLAMFGAFGNE